MPDLDVITIGETMLRLSPPDHQRLGQAVSFNSAVGGAESNVAIGLARLGKRSAWVSRLPDNPLGHHVADTIHHYGVNTEDVVWAAGERLGVYFIEFGAEPRPTRVWYDRADSAASHMTPENIPLDRIAVARWLHLTGITPALSPSCAAMVQTAITTAHAHHVTVSFDVNYRALLWTPEQAAIALDPLCQQADVTIIAARDAQNLFKTSADAEQAAHDLYNRWGGRVILTRSAEGAIGYDVDGSVQCAAFKADHVDRIGVGDAFDAGLICRLLEDAPFADALRFGAAMAALKLSIPSDLALVTRAEVEELLRSSGQTLHR